MRLTSSSYSHSFTCSLAHQILTLSSLHLTAYRVHGNTMAHPQPTSFAQLSRRTPLYSSQPNTFRNTLTSA